MNLLIVTPGKLPVPAVKGGAVETLIQILIDNNEIHEKYNIDLVSIYDKSVESEIKKYKYTNFIFINTETYFYKISRILRYLINRIPNVYIGNSYIKRVIKILKNQQKKYDFVIVENSPQYSLLLNKYFENNIILHMHNDFLNKDTNMGKRILNSYNKVFSLSNYINNRIQEIDKEYSKIFTLYNGVEIEKFIVKTEQNEIRKKYGINDNDFVYLYTGRIVPEKGVKELIEAFNKINEENVKLLIVGNLEVNEYVSKSYLNDIKNLAKLNDKVILTGKVDYKEMPFFYNAANVGVVPSTWEEPFALTVIEHMAAGNPVIISNSGAMPELVNNEVAIIVDKNKNFVDNLKKGLLCIKHNYQNYSREHILKQADAFNHKKYCDRFDELILKEDKNEIK